MILLQVHQILAHKIGSLAKCEYCDFLTPRKGDVSRHKREVHSRIKNIHCSLCDHITVRNEHLKIHINSQHLYCDRCSYRSKSKRDYLKHIKRCKSEMVLVVKDE